MKTILVVEDKAELLEIVSFHIQEKFKNWVIVTADNGADALVVYRSRKPNFVVTDLYMPRLNGELLAAALKEKDPELPIFMITGSRLGVTMPQHFSGIYCKSDIEGAADAIFEYMKTFKRKERVGAVRAKNAGNF